MGFLLYMHFCLIVSLLVVYIWILVILVFVVCSCCVAFFDCCHLCFVFCFDMGYVLIGLMKYLIAAFYVHVCGMGHCVLEGKP
jgi:hypothetical protein